MKWRVLALAFVLGGCGTDHAQVFNDAFQQPVASANVDLALVITAPDGESAIHVDGPYERVGPRFDWKIARHGPPGQVESRMVSSGKRLFYLYDDHTYQAEDEWIRKLRQSGKGDRVGALGSEGLTDLIRRTRNWVGRDATYDDATIDGEDVTRVTSRLEPEPAVSDLSALSRHAGGAPPPDEFAATGGKPGRVTIDVAQSDGTLRRIEARIPVSQLGGEPATLEFSLRLTDVNRPVKITAPTKGEPLVDFQTEVAAAFSSTEPQGQDDKVRAAVHAAHRKLDRLSEPWFEARAAPDSSGWAYRVALAAYRLASKIDEIEAQAGEGLADTPDYERAHRAVRDTLLSYRDALYEIVPAYEDGSQTRFDAALEKIRRAEEAYAVAVAFFY